MIYDCDECDVEQARKCHEQYDAEHDVPPCGFPDWEAARGSAGLPWESEDAE